VDTAALSLPLALLRISGVGSLTLNRLLTRFGSAQSIFSASRAELSEIPRLTKKSLEQILVGPNLEQIQPDLEWLATPSHTLLQRGGSDYPPLLLEIPDPPPLLFVAGDLPLLTAPQIAIVGSRSATPAGIAIARELAGELATIGITVTSGLASGIDSAAHRGALQADGRTIAVIGTGPDRVYPTSNRELSRQITARGTLISEYPVGTPPLRENFPRRNRIISGLSLGVVVVEASLRSGSLITAGFALEQNREVFAVPGSIRSSTAKGCHKLIKQGAKLTESATDIVEEIAGLVTSMQPATTSAQPRPTLSEKQHALLKQMDHDPISLDAIVQRSGLTAAEVSSMLLQLEVLRLVVHAPGGLYQKSC